MPVAVVRFARVLLLCLAGLPAAGCTFVVDSPVDAPDANPGDGRCERAPPAAGEPPGRCTLRAAIQEANASPTVDHIEVPAGRYVLTLPTSAGGGPLTVTQSVVIHGSALGETLIDAGGRCAQPGGLRTAVMWVQGGRDVQLGQLTLMGGNAQAGGGLRVDGGNVTLHELRLRENFGFTGGGGMSVAREARVTVRRSTFEDNCATGAFGGGIWNFGELWVYDSTIARNVANRAGGIRNQGLLNLRNTTVSGNRALSPEAGTGGLSQAAFAVLNNVTLTGNTGTGSSTASFQGGGLQTTTGATTVMKNSIVAGNDGGSGPDDCAGPLTPDSRYNLVGSTTGCTFTGLTDTFLLGVDPQLGALAFNGGPTATHLPGPTSPVRERGFPGSTAAADGCQPGDQRGVPRPQGQGRCDLGAVELTASASFVVRFYLVDADTDADLFVLHQGDQLNLRALPPRLSVRAELAGPAPGSVVFGLDASPAFQVENVAPYALGGDSPAGNFTPVPLAVGTHTLTATPYVAAGGVGAAGGALRLSFELVDVPTEWPR